MFASASFNSRLSSACILKATRKESGTRDLSIYWVLHNYVSMSNSVPSFRASHHSPSHHVTLEMAGNNRNCVPNLKFRK
jgi:hypothetical protein